MEQWEKEYLEIKQREKQPNTISNKQKEYIDICWEEVERSDGTKWYIPIKKEKQKQQRKRNLRVLLNKTFRVACIIIAICIVLCLLWSHFYARGLGLKNMCTVLSEIESSQTAALNSFVTAGYSLSEEEIVAWKINIDKDLALLDRLIYHPSYKEVVKGHVSLLLTLQDFIDACLSGDYISSQLAHTRYSALLIDNRNKLFDAFERNFVKYQITSEGYVYWIFRH